ncbi:MAG: NifB/NifX family molybdenum-iron cluster-binding protein [Candidatus Cloacimonadaceae bacterium]|nr:NifB/NifX family molybdenum-iron cluster-binding protein [Candidatus Cloacimonadaceae bacterium]
MKYAFTAKGETWDAEIDPRFGRTDFLLIYDDETDTLSARDNRSIENVAHGAGTKTAANLFELKPEILITGNGPGENARQALAHLSLKIYIGAAGMTVKEAFEAYKTSSLTAF